MYDDATNVPLASVSSSACVMPSGPKRTVFGNLQYVESPNASRSTRDRISVVPDEYCQWLPGLVVSGLLDAKAAMSGSRKSMRSTSDDGSPCRSSKRRPLLM